MVASGRDGGPTLLNLLGRLVVGDGIQTAETTPRLKTDFDSSSTATLLWESVGGAEGAAVSPVSRSPRAFRSRNICLMSIAPRMLT